MLFLIVKDSKHLSFLKEFLIESRIMKVFFVGLDCMSIKEFPFLNLIVVGG